MVNKYLVVKELGKGATGEVYMVRDEETGQPYAMKVTNRYTAGWSDENAADRAIAQEIAVMKKLQHQNIVNLIEVRSSLSLFLFSTVSFVVYLDSLDHAHTTHTIFNSPPHTYTHTQTHYTHTHTHTHTGDRRS